jgi:hypothetical protein
LFLFCFFTIACFSKGTPFEEHFKSGETSSSSSTSELVGGRFSARHQDKGVAPMSGMETISSQNRIGAFHLLAKPTGAACNRDCKYCFGQHNRQHNLCVVAPTCGNALAREHNGDLYSCDHFVEPDLGNIRDAPMRSRGGTRPRRSLSRRINQVEL